MNEWNICVKHRIICYVISIWSKHYNVCPHSQWEKKNIKPTKMPIWFWWIVNLELEWKQFLCFGFFRLIKPLLTDSLITSYQVNCVWNFNGAIFLYQAIHQQVQAQVVRMMDLVTHLQRLIIMAKVNLCILKINRAHRQ